MTFVFRYMMASLGACFFLGTLHAQEETLEFVSPFDFPLKLSANFGELRTGHLHGGLDIKTEGTVGKPVRCIADGYVSRATVSNGGFGQAIYVTHPNGMTSVYGHILGFAPAVAKIVEEYQYEHETYEADLRFEPRRINCKVGEIIAFSGNEGFSFGPHLHLELHTEEGELVDPMPYYRNKITDTAPPKAIRIKVYPQRGEGVVNGSQQEWSVPLEELNRPIEAWGKIALGVSANDYMDGTTNHYGVKQITLSMDTTEIFKSLVESFRHLDNRFINAWTDFTEQEEHNRWVMRSHILPGNRLGLLRAKDRGIVDIREERDYLFTYFLEDGHGNTAVCRFTIRGVPQQIVPYRPEAAHYLVWDRPNFVQEPGMELLIPRGMLSEDVALNSRVLKDSAAISFTYQLNDKVVPLNGDCRLRIGIRRLPVADTAKYYIARKHKGRITSAGGIYENGWITANIRELGTYTAAIDTVGPKITPQNRKSWATGNIRFHVGDAGVGVKSYRVTVDGRFEVFGYNAKNGVLFMKYPSRLMKGIPHQLTVIAIDHSGNETRQTYGF